MEITTGVQEVTANVVVDSYNKVASPRKSRKDDFRKEETKVLSEEEAAMAAKKKSLFRK